MSSDLLAILQAFAIFPLVAIAPGYALGWLTNVLRFRHRTPEFRLVASVPLSLAVAPIVSFTIGRWFSLDAVLALFGCFFLFSLFLIYKTPPKTHRGWLKLYSLVILWLCIATFSLIDLQYSGRTYFSIIDFDYAIRIPITQSIATFGVPARNPFFFPAHAVPLRYHYFWMVLCALVRKFGGTLVNSQQTFIAGTLWGGIAVLCIIPLYLRLFTPLGRTNLHRRTLLAFGLLGITGLDILPAFLMLFLNYTGVVGGISPSVEWWNNQVDGWMYTMLWEPHYVCALVACLTGFLILWDTQPDAHLRSRLTHGLMAGLAFASAVGAGIYVPLVFAVFLAIWTVVLFVKRHFSAAAMFVFSGVVAAACAFPFLRTLAASKGSGGSFLQLTVRSFELAEAFLKILHWDRSWQITLANTLLLPLNYLLELGVFFLIGFLTCRRFWRRRRNLTPAELAAVLIAGSSMFVCTFVRSGVIANNDLGWRGFLFCQFVLLLWAVDLSPGPRALRWIRLFIFIGAIGVIYDLAILRFYPVLWDQGVVPKLFWMSDDHRLGERTSANKEAYRWLRAHTSPKAIVQQNPEVFQDVAFGLYGDRQTLAGGKGCLTTFGGDPDDCTPILRILDPVFSGVSAPESACQATAVDIFVVRDTDAAWNDKTSWVWTTPPIYQNTFVRMYSCPAKP
jgi:hypothetical protein